MKTVKLRMLTLTPSKSALGMSTVLDGDGSHEYCVDILVLVISPTNH